MKRTRSVWLGLYVLDPISSARKQSTVVSIPGLDPCAERNNAWSMWVIDDR